MAFHFLISFYISLYFVFWFVVCCLWVERARVFKLVVSFVCVVNWKELKWNVNMCAIQFYLKISYLNFLRLTFKLNKISFRSFFAGISYLLTHHWTIRSNKLPADRPSVRFIIVNYSSNRVCNSDSSRYAPNLIFKTKQTHLNWIAPVIGTVICEKKK